MRFKTRLLVVVLICTFAFGVGIQWADATSARNWCDRACNQACGRGECALAMNSGCTCYYFCESGDEGVAYCGS